MKLLSLAIVLLLVALVASWLFVPARNIALSVAEDEDVCPSVGEITIAEGSDLLSHPYWFARSEHYLSAGTTAMLCDRDGDWLGIIVMDKDGNCADIDRDNRRQVYRGGCPFGWLPKESVSQRAG